MIRKLYRFIRNYIEDYRAIGGSFRDIPFNERDELFYSIMTSGDFPPTFQIDSRLKR